MEIGKKTVIAGVLIGVAGLVMPFHWSAYSRNGGHPNSILFILGACLVVLGIWLMSRVQQQEKPAQNVENASSKSVGEIVTGWAVGLVCTGLVLLAILVNLEDGLFLPVRIIRAIWPDRAETTQVDAAPVQQSMGNQPAQKTQQGLANLPTIPPPPDEVAPVQAPDPADVVAATQAPDPADQK